MVKLVGVAAAALMLAAGLAGPVRAQDQAETEQAHGSQELALIVSDNEAWAASEDPWTAGAEGDRSALSRLPDGTRAGELARREPLGRFRDRLSAVDTTGLSAEDRLNHALLSRSITLDLERIERDRGRLAFESEGGPETMAGYLASSTRIATRAVTPSVLG